MPFTACKPSGNLRLANDVPGSWGWREQILRLLVELGHVLDEDDSDTDSDKVGPGVGQLTPEHLRGSIEIELLALTFADQGAPGERQVDRHGAGPRPARLVPRRQDRQRVPARDAARATQLAKDIGAAFTSSHGTFAIARAALEVRKSEGPSRFYGVTLRLSHNYLLELAHFIPYLGTALTVADVSWLEQQSAPTCRRPGRCASCSNPRCGSGWPAGECPGDVPGGHRGGRARSAATPRRRSLVPALRCLSVC